MKRKLSETRPEPTAVISKSGVQSLILNEVRRAVKVTEAKMESLLEKVQRLECEPKDDLKIRKLEVHIKKVKRRGEASMAYVRKLGLNVAQTSDPQNQIALSSAMMSGTVDLSRSDSGDDVVEVTTPSLETRGTRSVSKGVQVELPSLDSAVKSERLHPREPSPPPPPPPTPKRLCIKEEELPESIAAENVRREHVQAEPPSPGRTPGTPSPAEGGHSSSSTSTLPAPTGTTRSKATVEESKVTAQMSKEMKVEPSSGDRAVKLDRKRLREPSPPASSSSSSDELCIKEEELPESIAAENAQREHVKAEPPSPGRTAGTPSLPAPTGTARSQATVEGNRIAAQRLSTASQDEGAPDLPPLPATPFPSMLPAAAASFSIPVKVELSLAYIQNPPRITVMWDAAEHEAATPPMESYSVFMTLEKTRGNGVYGPWKMITEVRALELPMVILIKREEHMARRRLCFAVVGKDEFGRFGPYSDVKHAVLPN